MPARVRVQFIGTGGATNECRYQACLLVERADGSGGPILLDTGLGMDVVRQLVKLGRDPAEMRDIFVSHRHNDHMGGLEPTLLWSGLRWLRQSGESPNWETRVYAEPRVLAVVEQLFVVFATITPRLYGERLRRIPLHDGHPTEVPGRGRLIPFLVDHEPPDAGSLGCVVEIDGVRLAYSGDTRPCERLVEMARGVEALFHEAGGLDADAEFVHRQGHSTAGDAGRAARAAGVGRLVLTHVPDDKLAEPMLAEARAAYGGRVDLATDLTVVEL